MQLAQLEEHDLVDVARDLAGLAAADGAAAFCLMATGAGSWLLFRHPVALRRPGQAAGLAADLAADLRQAGLQGLWWAGVLAYDAAAAFEPALASAAQSGEGSPGPAGALPGEWGLFRSAHVLDQSAVQCLAGLVRQELGAGTLTGQPFLAGFVPEWSFSRYDQAFGQVKAALQAGTSYQMNLTFRLGSTLLDPLGSLMGQDCGAGPGQWGLALQAWSRLLEGGQAREGCFWYCRPEGAAGATCLGSLSPELFFALDDGLVTCRPMKGTAPRSADPAEDLRLAKDLAASAKNQAENLMITDMIRNDLGKLAQPGSVKVEALFRVESYPTVHQMTSTVSARTTAPVDAVLQALFPCASITGAPRISTMRALARIEGRPRGWYTGSAGWVSPEGQARFNVLIRTLEFQSGSRVGLGVGGGVVWDSESGDEYREALLKSRFTAPLVRSFDLVETLRWTRPGNPGGNLPPDAAGPDGMLDGPGSQGFWFLEQHLERLCRAARAFGHSLEAGAAMRALLDWQAAQTGQPGTALKVRLAFSPEGQCSVTAQELGCPFNGEAPVPVALAAVPWPGTADATGREQAIYRCFKTDRRDIYTRLARGGTGQTLFYTLEGLLTESSTCNIVLKQAGRYLTPRYDGGFLAGTYRQRLLEQSRIGESSLTVADLFAAEEIWLINSVRGWILGRLPEPPVTPA